MLDFLTVEIRKTISIIDRFSDSITFLSHVRALWFWIGVASIGKLDQLSGSPFEQSPPLTGLLFKRDLTIEFICEPSIVACP